MADVAICIGHHPQAQGATLDLEGFTVTEFELWNEWGEEFALTMTHTRHTPHVIRRPNPDPDRALGRHVNNTGADAAIELHFNASANPDAGGCDMLHYPGSEEGKRLAGLLEEKVSSVLNVRARHRDTVDYPFVRYTDMPAVICEPAFGSKDAEAFKLLARQAELMKAYRDAIMAFLNSDSVA